MEPRLVSVDRSKPLGRLVDDYAKDNYWRGFWDGFLVGTSFTIVVMSLAVVCLNPS